MCDRRLGGRFLAQMEVNRYGDGNGLSARWGFVAADGLYGLHGGLVKVAVARAAADAYVVDGAVGLHGKGDAGGAGFAGSLGVARIAFFAFDGGLQSALP